MPTEVLIAGAGPTGLVLALWLARLGIRVRIVDRAPEPGTTSRALVVQARTLELYRQLGLAHTLVEQGLELGALNLWVKGKRRGRAELGRVGRGLSPFPYLLVHPQDLHERVLVAWLAAEGVGVERGTELVSVDDRDVSVRVRLRRADGTEETCEADYLAGCDGARSTVREEIAAGFPGGTYAHVFYVADVEADGEAIDGELHVSFDGADFIAVFPMRGKGRARLVGALREDDGADGEGGRREVGWEDLRLGAAAAIGIDVRRVSWFSTYRVHHRVANRFRIGRVFLLGDAAHVHSPVGGQGMNTGIGDAVNLSWKLAMVLRDEADPCLLATYEPERRAFALKLVATTDRIFQVVTRPGLLADRLRNLAPRLIAGAFRAASVRRGLFRLASQIGIEYRHGVLAEGRAGALHGGDRLPWVPARGEEPDNFASLASLRWQVHVYGPASRELARTCAALGLALHVLPFGAGPRRAGLARGALYLVRPDGYVALVDPAARPAQLRRFLERHALRPRQHDALRPRSGAAPAAAPPA